MELVKVEFKSNQLEVIEEIQSIVVKDICESIGLKFRTQYDKIKSDESFGSKLIRVQTNGGMQEVFTIPLSKLNGWLFSINPNKVKPEVKQKLIEYKKECFDVLNNYFNKGIAVKAEHEGKNIKCVINGYKSQISKLKNKIDTMPRSQDILIPITSEEVLKLIEKGLKYDRARDEYMAMYELYQDARSRLQKISTVVNQSHTENELLK